MKREAETIVHGKARPGERVRVGGVETEVAANGTFTAKVRLREGKNPPLVVEAESMDGRRRQLRGPALEIKSKLDIEVKPVQWGKPKP
jgi:hypothetical protein